MSNTIRKKIKPNHAKIQSFSGMTRDEVDEAKVQALELGYSKSLYYRKAINKFTQDRKRNKKEGQ